MTNLVNMVNIADWGEDPKKLGWLLIDFWGEVRWARPKFPPGIMYPIHRDWLIKYGKYLGVYVEEVQGSDHLCWSGFVVNDRKNPPDEVQDFIDSYPNSAFLFTEKWKIKLDDENNELTIDNVNGTSKIVISGEGDIQITSEGDIHLNGEDSRVVTTRSLCSFTGQFHPQGSSSVKCKGTI